MERLIQIAGISNQAEADLLIECGFKYLGFPLRLPVNKEDLSEKEAAEIIESLPNEVRGVLITYQNNADEIIEFCNKMHSNIIQLHGSIERSELQKIKDSHPEIKIFKSLVISGENTNKLEQMINELSDFCDAFITDTFDPRTGASGATGKTHDWNISKKFVEVSPIPVILAGGLTPKNVREAIEFVKPFGVDSHTGVEDDNGRKTKDLLKLFYSEAQKGFNNIKAG